jgi:hypothetical protein
MYCGKFAALSTNLIVDFYYSLQESTTADLPVFLRRGSFDAIAYRGVMVFSVVGIGLTFWCIGQIATGRMQKKH